MRRSSALLATAAVTASLVTASLSAVPGTARADATGVSLTVDFDTLAKDRVAKLTLSAKSASGVTGVRANMHYQTPDAEPYATVDSPAPSQNRVDHQALHRPCDSHAAR